MQSLNRGRRPWQPRQAILNPEWKQSLNTYSEVIRASSHDTMNHPATFSEQMTQSYDFPPDKARLGNRKTGGFLISACHTSQTQFHIFSSGSHRSNRPSRFKLRKRSTGVDPLVSSHFFNHNPHSLEFDSGCLTIALYFMYPHVTEPGTGYEHHINPLLPTNA